MKVHACTAPQQSVPRPKAAIRVREDFRLVRRSGATIGTLTECQYRLTRAVIKAVLLAHGWNWNAPLGSPAIAIWKRSEWAVVKRGVRPGHGKLKGVSKRRRIPWARLRNRATGQEVLLVAIFPCPIPTRKAPGMVPAARRAHVEYFASVISLLLAHQQLAAIAAGDPNTNGDFLGPSVGRRAVHYARDHRDPIVQITFVDAVDEHWTGTGHQISDQLASDHIFLEATRDLTAPTTKES